MIISKTLNFINRFISAHLIVIYKLQTNLKITITDASIADTSIETIIMSFLLILMVICRQTLNVINNCVNFDIKLLTEIGCKY